MANSEGSMEVNTPQSQMDTDSVAVDTSDGEELPKADNIKSPQEDILLQNKPSFPATLEGFQYKFNQDGQLRHIETDEPFVFKARSNDNEYNQLHYEALGEVITQYVYDLLEKDAGLKRVYLPVDAVEGEPQSFIFTSQDALTNPDKLLLLIHGSGVVRAGQWARRLIINDCLESGTQLPFIKKAQQLGYGIIVFNTNENSVLNNDLAKPSAIRCNDCPEAHAEYVWDEFVSKSKAKHIAIIAHSYGGVVTVQLANQKESDFKERVFAIAFTDSVHSLTHQEVSDDIIKLFKKMCVNWVSSKEPLDTPVKQRYKDECPQVSAGTNKHEETSWKSFKSIFTFLQEQYQNVSKEKEEL